MFLLAAAKPWIYWLAFLLVLGAALMIIGLVVGYLIKVVAAKDPRQQQ
jgi:preprotein translocase subunit Sss1